MGGRLIEWAGTEFMVRGRGYVKSTADLEKVVVKASEKGTPVLLRDVASIILGPQIRRGVLDFNGEGDSVGGIVVMRHGENALNVINRVKAKLDDMKKSLPEGVEMVMPGDNINLEVALITPIALEKELRFAIREGGHTVGAGVVTEVIE